MFVFKGDQNPLNDVQPLGAQPNPIAVVFPAGAMVPEPNVAADDAVDVGAVPAVPLAGVGAVSNNVDVVSVGSPEIISDRDCSPMERAGPITRSRRKKQRSYPPRPKRVSRPFNNVHSRGRHCGSDSVSSPISTPRCATTVSSPSTIDGGRAVAISTMLPNLNATRGLLATPSLIVDPTFQDLLDDLKLPPSSALDSPSPFFLHNSAPNNAFVAQNHFTVPWYGNPVIDLGYNFGQIQPGSSHSFPALPPSESTPHDNKTEYFKQLELSMEPGMDHLDPSTRYPIFSSVDEFLAGLDRI